GRPRGRAGSDLRPVHPGHGWPANPRRSRARTADRASDRRGARRYGPARQRRGAGGDVHPGSARGGKPSGGGVVNRILIAEDEPRIASFLEKGLRANGYVTTVV